MHSRVLSVAQSWIPKPISWIKVGGGDKDQHRIIRPIHQAQNFQTKVQTKPTGTRRRGCNSTNKHNYYNYYTRLINCQWKLQSNLTTMSSPCHPMSKPSSPNFARTKRIQAWRQSPVIQSCTCQEHGLVPGADRALRATSRTDCVDRTSSTLSTRWMIFIARAGTLPCPWPGDRVDTWIKISSCSYPFQKASEKGKRTTL